MFIKTIKSDKNTNIYNIINNFQMLFNAFM